LEGFCATNIDSVSSWIQVPSFNYTRSETESLRAALAAKAVDLLHRIARPIAAQLPVGFALVGWPGEYGKTGVNTFIVNQLGRVHQKDLGASNAKRRPGTIPIPLGK
jgi:hypothetical protein